MQIILPNINIAQPLQLINQLPKPKGSSWASMPVTKQTKKQKIAQFIKTFDLFAQPVAFRYNDEPAYETLTGGLCSLAMVIVFIAVFAGTLTNTLNRIYIDFTVTQFQENDPTPFNISTGNFLFAVGITGQDMNAGPRWFDVYMQWRSQDSLFRNRTTVALQKCQKQQWTKINETYGEFYDKLKLNEWLCPPSNYTLHLEGKFTSKFFRFFKIAVKQCSSSLNPARPCVPNTTIQNYLNANQAFNFNFYFVNALLNPGKKEYVSNFIDDFNYFPFSPKTGTNANFFVSEFKISTDESIFPFQENNQVSGGIATTGAQTLNYEVRQNEYMKFYIRKSSLMLQIDRKYRKIDDTLSYIGGLFSAILSALLIIGMYNEFSYELDVAKNLYRVNKAEKLDADSFNIFVYLGYLVYMVFEKFGVELPWPRMKKYHHCLEEVRRQLDVRLVLQKVQYSERVAETLLEKHQIKGLHLQDYLTLEEAEQIRKDYKFYDQLQSHYFELDNQQNPQNQITVNCLKRQNSFASNMDDELIKPAQKNQKSAQIVDRQNNNKGSFVNLFKSQSNLNNTQQTEDKDAKFESPTNQEEDEEKKEFAKKLDYLRECLALLKSEKESGSAVSQRVLQKIDQTILSYHPDLFPSADSAAFLYRDSVAVIPDDEPPTTHQEEPVRPALQDPNALPIMQRKLNSRNNKTSNSFYRGKEATRTNSLETDPFAKDNITELREYVTQKIKPKINSMQTGMREKEKKVMPIIAKQESSIAKFEDFD